MPAPVISLAAYKAAIETPSEPLDPLDSVSLACLRHDWEEALTVTGGDQYLAHLWAMRLLCDDMAEHDDPTPALTFTSDAILDAVAEAGRARK